MSATHARSPDSPRCTETPHPPPGQQHADASEFCRLSQYNSRFADDIVRWVASPQELTWLAPGTPPPLSAEKVAAWSPDRPNRYLFWSGNHARPAAYAELNPMPNRMDQMWIGHFLVSPENRGRSVGLRFAQALLARAFLEFAAAEVLLVVFPENQRAVRCYQRVGMSVLGRERKYFKATRHEFQFLRMGIHRPEFIRLIHSGAIPARPVPLVQLASFA